MNKVKQFFGWLFLTQGYLDTLSDDVIRMRAGVTSKRYGYQFEDSSRNIRKAHVQLAQIWASYVIKRPTIIFVKEDTNVSDH